MTKPTQEEIARREAAVKAKFAKKETRKNGDVKALDLHDGIYAARNKKRRVPSNAANLSDVHAAAWEKRHGKQPAR